MKIYCIWDKMLQFMSSEHRLKGCHCIYICRHRAISCKDYKKSLQKHIFTAMSSALSRNILQKTFLPLKKHTPHVWQCIFFRGKGTRHNALRRNRIIPFSLDDWQIGISCLISQTK